MAFVLKPGRPVRRELRRLCRKELRKASDRLRQDGPGDEDVHEARKSAKKAEAIAALLDALGSAPPAKPVKRLRNVRRGLSRLRDADAMIVTLDRLRSRFGARVPEHTAAVVRNRLLRRKNTVMRRASSRTDGLAAAACTLRSVRRSAKRWKVSKVDPSDLPKALARGYRAGRKAMGRARTRGGVADFHTWRKRTKRLWYQLRLAERHVTRLTTRNAEFEELETVLGDAHNLAVFRESLGHDRELRRMTPQVRNMEAMAAAFQSELERAALVLGDRLYRSSPKAFKQDLAQRLRPQIVPSANAGRGWRGRKEDYVGIRRRDAGGTSTKDRAAVSVAARRSSSAPVDASPGGPRVDARRRRACGARRRRQSVDQSTGPTSRQRVGGVNSV